MDLPIGAAGSPNAAGTYVSAIFADLSTLPTFYSANDADSDVPSRKIVLFLHEDHALLPRVDRDGIDEASISRLY